MKLISPEYRITVATILLTWALTISTIAAFFDEVNPDPTIVIATITLSSGLLGAGLLKKKEKKSEPPVVVEREH